jgi:hypothetical protein
MPTVPDRDDNIRYYNAYKHDLLDDDRMLIEMYRTIEYDYTLKLECLMLITRTYISGRSTGDIRKWYLDGPWIAPLTYIGKVKGKARK